MRGSGYKISAKFVALQFPLGRDSRIALRKRHRAIQRKSSREEPQEKEQKSEEEKENSYCRKKN